ncbi:transposase, Mutator family protein, partial [Escherichia coli MP021017.10]
MNLQLLFLIYLAQGELHLTPYAVAEFQATSIVYLDCIVLKVRQDSRVINKSVFLALGINIEGQKELLGMWLAE